MMEDYKLTNILESLREIEPSAGFVARSRSAILSTPRRRSYIWSLAGLKHSAREGLGFALSVGMVSAVIALILSSAPRALDSVVGDRLPSAETRALVNDADAAVKDIDIHLEEIHSFDAAAKKTGAVLKEVPIDKVLDQLTR
jgi:hypothetical protein